MSRIGKKPIEIPEKVETRLNDGTFFVKGPLGELTRTFKTEDIDIKITDNLIILSAKRSSKPVIALWGTYASHIGNMVEGVTKGYEKKLIVEGVGFRVNLEGNTLVLKLGFSHLVNVEIPEGLKVEVEKNNIKISGIDKEMVGAFAAKVKAYKKPEPYKGKGIRYEGEHIRRKTGKKTA